MNQKRFIGIALAIVLLGALGYVTLKDKTIGRSTQTTHTVTGDREDINTMLTKEQRVRVIVTLVGNQFTAPEFQDDARKAAEVTKLQDDVLATLSPDDFTLSRRFKITPSFAGDLSRSGFEKLLKNKHVFSLSLDRAYPPIGAPSPLPHQTTAPIVSKIVIKSISSLSGSVGREFRAAFEAIGIYSSPPFLWRVSRGILPPGVQLVESPPQSAVSPCDTTREFFCQTSPPTRIFLHGMPIKDGIFAFTLEVRDTTGTISQYEFMVDISLR